MISPPLNPKLPEGLPSWLAEFVLEAMSDTETLRANGADQAAAARDALVQRLLVTATAWLDSEIDASQAAEISGVCEETIRRRVRQGTLPDHRSNPTGRHRIRRGDLEKVAAPQSRSYDVNTDAQDIARQRRRFP